jgi:hypothetical protein
MLESALREMRCMVVLWSSHSIESDWVKEEAEEARLRKKLVPVLIEAVIPPVGFRTIQAADLTDWDGVGESRGVRQLIADLELILGKSAPRAENTPGARLAPGRNANQTRTEVSMSGVETAGRRAERPPPTSHDESKNSALRWKIVAASGVALALALGIFALPRNRRPAKQAVAVIETDSVPERSPFMPSAKSSRPTKRWRFLFAAGSRTDRKMKSRTPRSGRAAMLGWRRWTPKAG